MLNLFNWELHIQEPSRALKEMQLRDIIFPLNILILNQVRIFLNLEGKMSKEPWFLNA